MNTISIIIPVKHGGHVRAIESLVLLHADLTANIEVYVAEGSAPSQQRNRAASLATGEILYFLDDDSRISDLSIGLCQSAFEDDSVAVAGGPSLTPADDTALQKLFAGALQSLFGAGAMRYRYRAAGTVRKTTDKELILCNLAIRRSVFMEMGGFDERLYPNEENELLDRIRMAGYSALHIPGMSVYRSQRTDVWAFVRQMFGYGRGRAQQFLVSKRSSMASFVPLFFLIYILGIICFRDLHLLLLLPLLLYVLLDLGFTFQSLLLSRYLFHLWLMFLFPLMHLANGCGLLAGLLGGMPQQRSDDSISTRCIKSFGEFSWHGAENFADAATKIGYSGSSGLDSIS